MITDPIADLCVRVKNANMAHQSQVKVSGSKLKEALVNIFKQEGFIKDYSVSSEKGKYKEIEIQLKYGLRHKRVISGVTRISKPGRRIYASVGDLKKYTKAFGVTVLSTQKGILTDKGALREKVGGEVLLSIW